MQATMPDAHHREAPWQLPAERSGLRTFAGGVAFGALLGVAALQLSIMLREPDVPSGPEAATPPHVAVAYLAEKAPARRAVDAAAPSSAPAAKPAPAVAIGLGTPLNGTVDGTQNLASINEALLNLAMLIHVS